MANAVNLANKNIAKRCENGTNKAPGIIDKIWWAAICDFTSIADLPTITDIDVYGLITTAHTFTGTKGFTEILDAHPGTGKYSFSPNGEKGFGLFKVEGEVMTVGHNPKVIGFINQEKYRPGIAIVKLMSGEYKQIGCETHPAYLTAEFDSLNNTASGEFGIKLKVSADQPLILAYNAPTLAITINS